MSTLSPRPLSSNTVIELSLSMLSQPSPVPDCCFCWPSAAMLAWSCGTCATRAAAYTSQLQSRVVISVALVVYINCELSWQKDIAATKVHSTC
eukprot:9835-Heterococcus_DN1.PRE.4